jgi:hypothetical protein
MLHGSTPHRLHQVLTPGVAVHLHTGVWLLSAVMVVACTDGKRRFRAQETMVRSTGQGATTALQRALRLRGTRIVQGASAQRPADAQDPCTTAISIWRGFGERDRIFLRGDVWAPGHSDLEQNG